MEINYLAILVAAVANMVVGAIWYGPLFGKKWRRLTGIKKSDMKKTPKLEVQKMHLTAFATSLIVAYALFMLGSMLGMESVEEWTKLGFLIGLVFVGGAILPGYLWEGKSKYLWKLNVGATAVGMAIMGAVIASL